METDRDNKGKFSEGNNLGRPKGLENKTTTAAKELMISALEDQSEEMQRKFKELANEDAATYLNILSKFLPYILPKKMENVVKIAEGSIPIQDMIKFNDETKKG